MSVEGRLTIDLTRAGGGRPGGVRIASTRPVHAARVFEARTPDAVLQLLPLLYSICAVAQAQAAQTACERALGVAPEHGVRLARELLVCLETAREHLWRILIDWPAFVDEDSHAARAAPLTRLLPDARNALFVDGRAFGLEVKLHAADRALHDLTGTLDALLERTVFGSPPGEWLAINDPRGLQEWSRHAGSIAARVLRRVQDNGWEGIGAVVPAFLPPLPDARLDARLRAPDADAFLVQPDWQGQPRETTPLARQQEHPLIRSLLAAGGAGLLARLVALLVELAQMPERVRVLAAAMRESADGASDRVEGSVGCGVGLAQVEAARGRLVHHVELEHGCVRRYRILAPTEWNFHPAGALAQGLMNLPAEDTAVRRRLAAVLINAVDPCVGYDLSVD
jgi:coenzyme F420-reducing hydrogenase alpha subunit